MLLLTPVPRFPKGISPEDRAKAQKINSRKTNSLLHVLRWAYGRPVKIWPEARVHPGDYRVGTLVIEEHEVTAYVTSQDECHLNIETGGKQVRVVVEKTVAANHFLAGSRLVKEDSITYVVTRKNVKEAWKKIHDSEKFLKRMKKLDAAQLKLRVSTEKGSRLIDIPKCPSSGEKASLRKLTCPEESSLLATYQAKRYMNMMSGDDQPPK